MEDKKYLDGKDDLGDLPPPPLPNDALGSADKIDLKPVDDDDDILKDIGKDIGDKKEGKEYEMEDVDLLPPTGLPELPVPPKITGVPSPKLMASLDESHDVMAQSYVPEDNAKGPLTADMTAIGSDDSDQEGKKDQPVLPAQADKSEVDNILVTKFPSLDDIPDFDKDDKKEMPKVEASFEDRSTLEKAKQVVSKYEDDDILEDLKIAAPLQASKPDLLDDKPYVEKLIKEIDDKDRSIKEQIKILKSETTKSKTQEKRLEAKIKKSEEAEKKAHDKISLLKQKEKDLEKREAEVKKALANKIKIEQDIDQKKKKVELMKSQYADEKKKFDEFERLIKAKEQSIIDKIDELEKKDADAKSEIRRLDKLNTDTEKKLARLKNKEEKDALRSKALSARESDLGDLKKELDKRQKILDEANVLKSDIENLKKDKKKVRDELDKLVDKRDTHLSIKLLHKKKTKLSAEVRALEAKSENLAKQINKDMSRINDYESVLNQEKDLEHKYKVLSAKERQLDSMKKAIQEDKYDLEKERIKAFQTGATDSYRPDVRLTEQYDEYEHDEKIIDQDIYALIKDARTAYKEKRVADLGRIFEQIRNKYETLNIDSNEKRRIYYMIMELKSDIELLITNAK